MRREDHIRLLHMVDACHEIMGFAEGLNESDLAQDRKLLLAIVKSIEIVGEAASKLSDATISAAPDIPWRNIIGMRNRLIHGYFAIDTEIVWKTAVYEIPPLLESLKHLIEKSQIV